LLFVLVTRQRILNYILCIAAVDYHLFIQIYAALRENCSSSGIGGDDFKLTATRKKFAGRKAAVYKI
jgi:hypothetical protein